MDVSVKQVLFMTVLAALTFASLLSVVISKYHERKQFVLSENLAAEKDDLYMRWESLQLERSALRAEGRVERIAREKLGMEMPRRDEVLLVGGGD